MQKERRDNKDYPVNLKAGHMSYIFAESLSPFIPWASPCCMIYLSILGQVIDRFKHDIIHAKSPIQRSWKDKHNLKSKYHNTLFRYRRLVMPLFSDKLVHYWHQRFPMPTVNWNRTNKMELQIRLENKHPWKRIWGKCHLQMTAFLQTSTRWIAPVTPTHITDFSILNDHPLILIHRSLHKIISNL